MTVYGYLIPDSVNKILSQKGQEVLKSLSIKKVVFLTEVSKNATEQMQVGRVPSSQAQIISSTTGAGGTGGTSIVVTQMLQYLNKQMSRSASLIIPNDGGGNTAAIFASESIAMPPNNYPQIQTVKEDFLFFVNGQFIEHSAITSFSQVGADLKLIVNSGSLGFEFELGDEVIGVGKFNS